jgi:hypothetical protein
MEDIETEGLTEGKRKRPKAGHQKVLTVAKAELLRNGWNPYSGFLDDERIDLVARKNTGKEILYVDVQVKKFTLFRVREKWQSQMFDFVTWRFLQGTEFDDCNPNLVVALVLTNNENRDYQGDIFFFTAARFAELLKQAVPSVGLVKPHLARSLQETNRWFWCKVWRKGMELDPDSVIEVSDARQGFHVLDEVALRRPNITSMT